MSDLGMARGICIHCSTPLEFPLEAAHATVPCPSCQNEIELIPGEPTTTDPAAVEEPAAEMTAATASDPGAEITGTIPPTRVSLFYKVGLLFVAAAMAVLPLIYLALIAVAGLAVYIWATAFFGLTSLGGGIRARLFFIICYITPLFAGLVLVFFMIKPLFARRARHAQPLAVNPEVDAKLFAFVKNICGAVGAPMPTRIDIDCNLNASASFRRGFKSFFGNDLVLTIGLPLVAGLTTRQLAGVVAHEFGHFTQGFGMRLSYCIRSINGWFARVAYDRDAWDMALEEWAEDTEDWRMMIVVNSARFAVWCSRLVLKALMYIGHGIGCFMLRQMEYDADHYEVQLAGTEAFEATFTRMHVLGSVLKSAYKDMRTTLNVGKTLPDNFPQYMLRHERALSAKKRTEIENAMGLEASGFFDDHPSNGDRIRRGRIASAPGMIHSDASATELFADFSVVAKQVTILHYQDDLRLMVDAMKLVPDMGPGAGEK